MIPQVDITALVEEEPAAAIDEALRDACREIGFVTVVGHGITPATTDGVVAAAHRFFSLPEASKRSVAPRHWNAENTNTYRGFFPSSVAGKQGLDIGEPKLDDAGLLARPFHERNRIPVELGDRWLDDVAEYFDAISRAGSVVLEAIVRALGGDAPLARRGFARPASLSTLRFNWYPERSEPVAIAKDDGAGLCCETHVDSGLLTLLHQDDRGGLQVRDAEGRWHDIPPTPGALVINTGLALETLTGGALRATQHRVLHAEGSRLSIPYFFEPVPDFAMTPASLGLSESLTRDARAPTQNYEQYLAESMQRFSEYRRGPDPASSREKDE